MIHSARIDVYHSQYAKVLLYKKLNMMWTTSVYKDLLLIDHILQISRGKFNITFRIIELI